MIPQGMLKRADEVFFFLLKLHEINCLALPLPRQETSLLATTRSCLKRGEEDCGNNSSNANLDGFITSQIIERLSKL